LKSSLWNGWTEIPFWVAVELRDELPLRRQVGHPSAADRDEPEVAVVIVIAGAMRFRSMR
jgi:hypothetical protein